MTTQDDNKEQGLTFKSLFFPLTTKKIVAIITGVGFLVYFNILFNGFVWDDLTYIIGNTDLKPFYLLKLMGGNTFNSSGYYRPLPAIYFSILYNLFDNSAFFYHFIQLSLHVVCAILLFFIFRKFFKKTLALVIALIFLVHPINVESVAYIGASQSELYFLFGGLAFYLCLKDVLENKKIFFVHILLLLALLTKEVSVLFFFLIYFYRWLYKKGLSKIFFLSSVVTFFTYLSIRFWGLGGTILEKMHLIPISEISLLARITNIPIIFFYYLKTFFLPVTLVIDQIWTIKTIDFGNFYFPLIVDVSFLIFIFAALFYFIRKKNPDWKPFLFFMIWYLLSMSLLLQIFPLDMTVADRWFYFPMVGILGMMGILAKQVLPQILKKYSVLALSALIVLLVVLSLRTMIRNADWYSIFTLYSKDTTVYPNYDLEDFLGAYLVGLKDYQGAKYHFEKSVQLLPHDTNMFNLGSVYETLGDYKKAMTYYQEALDVKNKYSIHTDVRRVAYIGLGRLILLHEHPTTIVPQLKNATEEFPSNGTFWAYLAINQYFANQDKQALISAKKAITLFPNEYTNQLYQKILHKQALMLQ